MFLSECFWIYLNMQNKLIIANFIVVHEKTKDTSINWWITWRTFYNEKIGKYFRFQNGLVQSYHMSKLWNVWNVQTFEIITTVKFGNKALQFIEPGFGNECSKTSMAESKSHLDSPLISLRKQRKSFCQR